jgi:hypothetical protein
MEDSAAELPKYDWARDAGPLYTFLGLYLAGFQAIEGKLDQIILLAEGHDQWAATQARLATMKNAEKISEVEAAVHRGDRFAAARDNEQWLKLFDEVVTRLTAERQRRNSTMHSQYLLEGVEDGLAALRSRRRRENGEVRFDGEALTRDRMDAILSEVAQLLWDVGQAHIQLIHWVRD